MNRAQTTESEFDEWFETHSEECNANHQGSAGKIEVDSVVDMFSQCEEKFQVRYRNYVGDGVSKTYKAVALISKFSKKKTSDTSLNEWVADFGI